MLVGAPVAGDPPCPMRRPPFATLALSVAAALAAGCGGGREGEGHGLLVIAIESLRADHLEGYGYDRNTMPALEALAEGGVRFERVLASSPLRIPAHASLLTGSDPNLARRRVPQWFEASLDQAWSIPRAVPHLAVELAVAGYRTAAFVDHSDLAGGLGFDRGFQSYEQLWEADPREGEGFERTSKRVSQWLRDVRSDEDWFAFVHVADLERIWTSGDAMRDTYFEPRQELSSIPPVGSSNPCLFAIPPARWRGGSFTIGQYEARYDGALRSLDAQIGELLRQVDGSSRFANTTVCVIGSYGVQFGEAGLFLDHGRLSAADLHVPWILRPAPGALPEAGRRVASIASAGDLAPTLLDLCGIPVPSAMTGISQAPLAVGDADRPPREFAFASCGIQGGFAAFDREYALEVIFPAEAHPRVVEAWFGAPRDEPAPAVELRYRWYSDDYPGFAESTERGPQFERLRRAGANWIEHVEGLRSEVQEENLFLIGPGGEESP